MSVKYKGPSDSKLQSFLDIANQATDTFVNAVADMEECMAFRAFTVGGSLTQEQRNAMLDLLMTQFAIRMKEVAPELMEEKTITCATEDSDDGTIVWFKAINEKPEVPVVETPYKSFDPVEAESIPDPKVELLSPEEYEKRKAELMAEMAAVKAEAASTTESAAPADSD
jgi:uncharacterized small protein (DUF1192 family)